MKNVKVIPVLLALCLLGAVWGCAPGADGELTQQIVTVERGDIMVKVSADGNLSLPRDKKRDLTFETGGTIQEILAAEGDRVVQGQVLARLDGSSLEWDIKTLEAAVKTAEIALATASDTYQRITYPYSYRTFAVNIPAAVNAMDATISLLDDLLAAGTGDDAAPLPEDETALTDTERLEQMRKNLVEARVKLYFGEGDWSFSTYTYTSYWTIRSAQLSMESAEIALETARNNLARKIEDRGKLELKATLDGIVSAVDKEVGDKISSVYYASETVAQIVDTSRMELNADVDEIDIPLVSLGQEALLDIDALPDAEIWGKVTYISPLSRTEAGLVQYPIKVEFDVPAGINVKAGMTATADIVQEYHRDVLTVPDRAITLDASGNTVVKVALGEEEFETRTVTIGLSDGLRTEVMSGLKAGEEVVIEYSAR